MKLLFSLLGHKIKQTLVVPAATLVTASVITSVVYIESQKKYITPAVVTASKTTANGFSNTFAPAMSHSGSVTANFFSNTFVSGITTAYHSINNFFSNSVGTFFKTHGPSVDFFFTQTIPAGTSKTNDVIKTFFATNLPQVNEFFTTKMPNAIIQAYHSSVDFFSNTLPNSIKSAYKQSGTFFSNNLPRVYQFFTTKMPNAMIQAYHSSVDFFRNTLPNLATSVYQKSTTFFNSPGINKTYQQASLSNFEIFSGVKKNFIYYGNTGVEYISQYTKNGSINISALFSKIMNIANFDITTKISKFSHVISSYSQTIMTQITDYSKTALNYVTNFVTKQSNNFDLLKIQNLISKGVAYFPNTIMPKLNTGFDGSILRINRYSELAQTKLNILMHFIQVTGPQFLVNFYHKIPSGLARFKTYAEQKIMAIHLGSQEKINFLKNFEYKQKYDKFSKQYLTKAYIHEKFQNSYNFFTKTIPSGGSFTQTAGIYTRSKLTQAFNFLKPKAISAYHKIKNYEFKSLFNKKTGSNGGSRISYFSTLAWQHKKDIGQFLKNLKIQDIKTFYNFITSGNAGTKIEHAKKAYNTLKKYNISQTEILKEFLKNPIKTFTNLRIMGEKMEQLLKITESVTDPDQLSNINGLEIITAEDADKKIEEIKTRMTAKPTIQQTIKAVTEAVTNIVSSLGNVISSLFNGGQSK